MGKVWEWFWLGTNAGPYELEISHRSVKSLMKLSQLKLPIHKTSSFSYALIENIHTPSHSSVEQESDRVFSIT